MSLQEWLEKIDSVVKRDDIRGIAGETITPEFAFNLGRSVAALFMEQTAVHPVNIVVGHDARRSGPMLARALCDGLALEGCRPIELGVAGTEVVGFMPAKYSDVIDGGVIITASHNPREYNGFKFFGRQGQPLPLARTLPVPAPEGELQRVTLGAKKGMIPNRLDWDNFAGDYAATVVEKSGVDFRSLAKKCKRPLKVLVEAGNGVGGIIARMIARHAEGLDWAFSHDNPDGLFPVVVPNPLTSAYQEVATAAIRAAGADVGLCFDGDADRATIFDEQGRMIPPSIITALAGQKLRERGGEDEKIAHNLATSWCVADLLGDRNNVLGDGPTVITPVGYGKIKPLMFEMPAIAMGAEHSGHYIFRDFWRADSGMMVAVILLELALEALAEGRKVSDLWTPIDAKYFNSNEFNFQLDPGDPARNYIEQAAKKHEAHAKQILVVSEGRCVKVNTYPPPGVDLEVDDVRIEFKDWWFVMRRSGTEAEKGDILRCYVESTDSREHTENVKAEFVKMAGKDRLIAD